MTPPLKRLTLVRHAKSDWSLPGQEDWDRPLNKRGLRDAPEMARRLRERGWQPDLVLASPAVRALSTATIMARELRFDPSRVAQDERLYLASAQALLAVVRELGGDAAHLMVFGHNPGLTDFANRLAPGAAPDNVVTCGVFSAGYALANWAELDWGSARDAEFDYPKNG